MQALLRTTLLVTFAAVGIGIAIAIAAQPGGEREVAANSNELAAREIAELRLSPTDPTPAAYRPAVTSQVAPDSVSAPPPAIVPAEPLRSSDDTMNRLRDFLDGARAAAVMQAQPLPIPPPALREPLPTTDTLPQPEAIPGTPPAKISRDASDDRLTINVQNSDIREVLELLSHQGGLNILASKSVTGSVTASLTGVDIETALAAILKSTGYVARREKGIIYIGTPADFLAMDQTQDRLITRVYRPNYVKAADLQTLITPLLTPEIGRATVSTPSEIDIPNDQVKTGGNNFADSDVVIVRDYEAVMTQVDQIFCEVDVKPRQVSIEAMILSVKLSDEFKMGVDFALLRDKANVRLISGKPINGLANLDLTDGGLHFAFLDDNTGVFINALEKIGDTNVIASPRLMCLNKQRAEIQIGEELGYISTTVTETTAVQTVNFLDVGTLLRLRPFITNDGQIRMELHPELSTGVVEDIGGQTVPNKTVTQVTTNVICPDGATVIIGGLIREDLQTTAEQIPWLGSLPYLGPAFRRKTEKVDRAEIIVLITPRIVSEPMMTDEAVKYGNEFTERQAVYFDKMSPLGKRNIANHWLRKARAAYVAADYTVAMRQVNMAIHFDPVNRDSINLRGEIVAAGGFEDESIHEYLHQGLPPQQRVFKDYSKKGYPWKKFEGFSGEPEVSSIPDPGSPGPVRTLQPDLELAPFPVVPLSPAPTFAPIIPGPNAPAPLDNEPVPIPGSVDDPLR
jgi:type IV pilus assembly protein PilQ